MITPYLISTNAQKLLGFFLLNPDQSFFEREVSRKTGISPSSTNHALTCLYKARLLNRQRRGRMCFYSIDKTDPYLKEFKVLNNLLSIEPLTEKLKKYSSKIVLFGSWADGTDAENSDIDLFIVSSEKEKVLSITNKFSCSDKLNHKKIQTIIRTPQELLQKQDRQSQVLLEQIETGKLLWEREIHEDNL